MKITNTGNKIYYPVKLSEEQRYGHDVALINGRPQNPELKDPEIEADESRRYLKPGEGNLCITVAPGERLGELDVSLQYEGPKGQHNPCMADQNELLVEGSGWLRRFLGEMFGENAQLEVEIEGNPCPKADLALQIELASEVLQGRLDVENAIRQCRETQAAVLGKVNAEVEIARQTQVAGKITSES